MALRTYDQSPFSPPRIHLCGGLLVIILLFVLGFAVYVGSGYLQQPVVVPPDSVPYNMVAVIKSEHATIKHPEAKAIRRCLTNKAPLQVWRDKHRKDHFFRLCKLEDGRIGLQVILKRGRRWFEKTAFVVEDGSWEETIHYLSRFAKRFRWPLSRL